EPRVQVLRQGQFGLEQPMGVAERIVALRDAELAEVLTRRAVGTHVVRGQQCEAGIRSARCIGQTASRANTLKLSRFRRKESTWLVSAPMQATTSASPACTARSARRIAT